MYKSSSSMRDILLVMTEVLVGDFSIETAGTGDLVGNTSFTTGDFVGDISFEIIEDLVESLSFRKGHFPCFFKEEICLLGFLLSFKEEELRGHYKKENRIVEICVLKTITKQ
ncbi:506_t:CDS:2 [Gigaspora margarita]|uniref:506_t:CDS:1 n=1 Tax=Gigaspora margarita TaxID=4874 RepID=A0ABN7UGK4_GIGMA|nr:506_t:CDS:2 [Gigaspora margarita]